jgi:dipeptidase E
MRLFLASQDFGNHVDRLKELVGNNKKVLLIQNPKDYYDQAGRDASTAKWMSAFHQNGFEPTELDLRKYFKNSKLRLFVDEYAPGLVYVSGGNTFILRRAMRQSGFDKILQNDLNSDQYVYGGCSAGSIVVGPSLEGYETGDDPGCAPPGYEPEIIWDCLDIIDERIIPHVDTDWYSEPAQKHKEYFDEKNWSYIMLNDSDVLVIDGDKKEILR